MTSDPYLPHLRQADDLFARGEIVKAGQIWQAILKQQPTHAEARERLLMVKQRLLALREAETAVPQAPPPPPVAEAAVVEPTHTPAHEPGPAPEPLVEPPAPLPEPIPVPPSEPEPAPEPQPTLQSETALPVPEAPPVPGDVRSTAPEAPLPSDARSTAPEAPPPVDPAQVTTGTLDPERLVNEGCTLYDMGQLGDALKKWEQALTLDPGHTLARGYANGVRRELGHSPMEAAPSPAPVRVEAHHAEEDIDKLLREAVQLYDMGLTEEAITKWERVLALEPERSEIQGYLRQARTEVGLNTSGPTAAPPTPGPTSDSDGLDLKLRQAEHLLTLQRHEEAAFTFQQALSLAPGNARALQGLERCRKPGGQVAAVEARPAPVVSLDEQGRIAMAVETSGSTEPQSVEPPAALLKTAQPPREGLSLPERLREATERMPWLKDTRIIAGVGGGIMVLAIGLGLVHSYRKDQALKEDVLAARRAAVAPVAEQAQAPDLTESPEAIREEAEATLVTDPLRAYLRAQTLVNRKPTDASGPQLLEKARAGLSGGVTGASLAEYQKHLQNGDLEAALKVMDALLRARPDDADLCNRAGRLHLALCTAHAGQAKWEEAQEDLLRGRALFPTDKSWQMRLKLLDKIKALPKPQQGPWISLLG